MAVGGGREAELGEDVPDMSLHRLGRHEELARDRLVGAALGHQGEYRQLTLGEARQRTVPPLPSKKADDDLGVDHGLAVCHPADGTGELSDVGDAVLQHVADAAWLISEQVEQML